MMRGKEGELNNYYLIIYSLPQMKYLAAYALLTLSGKKDISNTHLIQKQPISSPSLETSDLTSLMKTSIDASTALRENPFTNSLLRDRKKSDQALELQLLLLPQMLQRRRRRKRKNNKRKPHHHPLRKKKLTKTWETCSVDAVPLFKSHYHN